MFDCLRAKRRDRQDPSSAALEPAVSEEAAALRRLEALADASLAAIGAMQAEVSSLRAESGDSAEVLKKLARSFGRTALRVEEIEHKVDALSDAVGAQGARVARDLEALFDALDLLDRALDSIDRVAAPELGLGLDGVHGRLVRYLEAEGFTRIAARGLEPDGTRMRVVGTAEGGDMLEGRVIAVVRAAITQGERLVRQGEVITARRALTTETEKEA